MEDSNPNRRRAPRFRFGNGQRLVGAWMFPLLISLAAGQAIEDPSVDRPIPKPDEPVIELPPFQVSPAEGWVAQDTLVGTGLRTRYRDLAAQIEALTPDFMEDFAVNSIEDAAIYTINVESADEFVQGNGYGGGLNRPFRIRGLGRYEQTRFYANTFLPTDRYNLSRTEIAYGPSSVLFGTDSYAGVINALPESASFSEGGSLKAQVDSNGSTRFEINYNQVLVEDVLSLRGAALYEDYRYEVEPGKDLDRRLFLTATWEPFPHTSIRAYFETVDIERSVPNRSIPDDLVSIWFKAGELPGSGYEENQPTFQNDRDWFDAGRPLNIGQQLFITGYQSTIAVVDRTGGSGLDQLASWENSVQIRYPDTWSDRSDLEGWNTHYTLQDDTYFPTDVGLIAALNQDNTTGELFNLFINQQIFEGLNLELSGHSERMEDLQTLGADAATTAIQVDANTYLPDGGTPNPYVGRLFVEESAAYRDTTNKQDMLRGALSYEYDFDQHEDSWLKWLGAHRVVGIASSTRVESRSQKRLYRVMPEILPDGELRFPPVQGAYPDPDIPYVTWQAYLDLRFRHYLDPSSGNVVPKMPFVIGEPLRLVDSDGVPFIVDPENTGFFDDQGHRLIRGSTNSLKWQDDVLLLSYQGNFWDNRIVFTYGYRRTEKKAAPMPWRPDIATGLRPHSRDVDFDPWEPDFDSTATTHMEGIVVAPFRGWLDLPAQTDLSFFFHQSQTTEPPNAWHDPFGNRYPGTHGEGEDVGFRLELMGGTLSLELNRFKVYSRPNPASYGKLVGVLGLLEDRVRELDPDFARLTGPTDIGFTDPLPQSQFRYQLMSDSLSSGYELSGRWAVNRNFEFRFTAADLEVTETNIGLEWWDWMDQRLPMYQTLDVPEGGVDSPGDINGDGEVGRWTWSTARLDDKFPETLSDYWENEAIKGLYGRDVTRSFDGKSNPFIRDLRINVNGLYRFTDGRLRGLKLGGAIRYREAPLLNYGGRIYEGTELLDLAQPLYGNSEWYLDILARYRFETSWMGDHATTVSLNVRNVLDQSDSIPSHLDINGAPVRMARVEGIKFILSLGVEL